MHDGQMLLSLYIKTGYTGPGSLVDHTLFPSFGTALSVAPKRGHGHIFISAVSLVFSPYETYIHSIISFGKSLRRDSTKQVSALIQTQTEKGSAFLRTGDEASVDCARGSSFSKLRFEVKAWMQLAKT